MVKIAAKGWGYDLLISYDDAGFKRFLDAQRTKIRDFKEPLSRFGEFIVNTHIPYQYHAQGAPSPWPELSPKYAMWKAINYPGMPLLVLTGAMHRGFYHRATKFSLNIENVKAYAKYHQTGTSKMPARKWLQLKDNDLGYGKLREYVKEYVLSTAQERFR